MWGFKSYSAHHLSNGASLPDPADQDGNTKMLDMKWSHAEKIIARKAFDQALEREY
jgi:hypothetical protein